ncbi:hypothetical protein [Actinomadura physcomitrii]|nr:hypothetical protein [Actinomadura physcomitrii]
MTGDLLLLHTLEEEDEEEEFYDTEQDVYFAQAQMAWSMSERAPV